ncbi:MAG TPA: sulfite exporter TauE/SafE family protein, partial [Burkholderiales bacterium]|nr:sulfite exporter TauE/SafE family protein [Burkholderiales bacterium]
GSIPGIWIGSQLASRAPERLLRSLLATVLMLIGGKLVI